MKEIINFLEDKDIIIDDNWYYHAVPFSRDIYIYINILNNGILAPYLISDNNSSYKYIFVSRSNGDKNGAFCNYSIYPNFIINNNIKAIKFDDSFVKKIIYNGFHNLKFTSLYKDEYQVYKTIKKEDIIGIIYNLDKLVNDYKNESNYYFKILYELVTLLNELEIDISIIDYYTKKEINKTKVIKLNNRL